MNPTDEARTKLDLLAERTADKIVKGLLEKYDIRPKAPSQERIAAVPEVTS
jgi:hypothetical protein